jgi:hypothetical protein
MKAISLVMLSAWALCTGDAHASGQAITSAAQLTQQSIQNTKSAGEQSVRVNQFGGQHAAPAQQPSQAYFDSHRTSPDCHCATSPFFSLNSSDVAPGTEITVVSPNPSAVIYYTTDGWTPTSASPRYAGPIAIHATTRLQAIAIEPQKLPSPVTEANYLVNGASPNLSQEIHVDQGVLVKGTELRFVTATKVNSETANIGDNIAILLDQNILSGRKVLAHRGMSADASIAWVERSGHGGKPGMIIFKLNSFTAQGTKVPLTAILTLAAPDIGTQTRRISDPTIVQVSGPLPPGNPAEILPGMAFTAVVAADTPVHP